MVHHHWQQITRVALTYWSYTFVQFVQHHKWVEKEVADWSGMRFQSKQIGGKSRCAPRLSNKSPLYSEAKSLPDCLRNLPEKCQQLLLSAVFLFACLPGRLYLAIIDLQCVKGHRIEDDSSRSNHGDFVHLFLWLRVISVMGKTLMHTALTILSLINQTLDRM